jgi:hypothetical protein
MKLGSKKLWLAASCLLCLAVAWRYGFVFVFAGTEASGGWLTSPIENLYDIGFLLFVLALLVTFFYRRVAAVLAITASLLCWPLYLYFSAPTLFRHVFRNAENEDFRASFVWSKPVIVGVLALAFATITGLLNLGTSKPAPSKEHD